MDTMPPAALLARHGRMHGVMIELDDEQAARLQRAVQERMGALRINQTDLQTRSGVSVATIRKIQNDTARSYNPKSLAAISMALWGNGQVVMDVINDEPFESEPLSAEVHPSTEAELQRLLAEERAKNDALQAELERMRQSVANIAWTVAQATDRRRSADDAYDGPERRRANH